MQAELPSIFNSRTGKMARSKKISLGFRVVNTRTGISLSPIFTRREPARDIAKRLWEIEGIPVGVQKVEAHVPAAWKRGDSLMGYVDDDIILQLDIGGD